MNQYFIFLLEASICMTLFYLVYLLLVKNDTFHKLKRYYLLISLVISILIPQLPSSNWIKDFEKTIIPHQINHSESLNYKDTFEKFVFGKVPDQSEFRNNEVRSIVPLQIMFMVYIFGMGLMLIRLIKNLVQVVRLVKRNEKSSYGKFTIVSLPSNYSTFSFFRFIFLNESNLGDSEKFDVLLHEKTHGNQGHSIDLILVEICKIFFWINPVIWLYRRSLNIVHECLADSCIVNTNEIDILDYQSLLLKQYLNTINAELTLPFNYSLIKIRINMMTKRKSKWWAKYKMALALPIILLGLLAFSNAKIELTKQNSTNSQSQKELYEPAPWGMLFVRPGSFELKRTDGNKTVTFNIAIDAFWLRETEVMVKQYFEYVEALKMESSNEAYRAALPDMTKAPFEGYFTSKEYKDFPIVGVSLMQAQEYCKWLTKQENEKLAKKGKPPVGDYRIPTEMEWVYASFGGRDPDKVEQPKITDLKKIQKGDFNDWGFLNMLDNVSEWTSSSFDPEKYMTEVQNSKETSLDHIIVKGNNYKNSLSNEKLILDGNISYDYVGLRIARTYIGDQYGETN